MSAGGRVSLELQHNEWLLHLSAGEAVWIRLIQGWSCRPLRVVRGAAQTSAGVVRPADIVSLLL